MRTDGPWHEAYDVRVELHQLTDFETGFRFRVMHHPGRPDPPAEIGRGEGTTFRLVDWFNFGGDAIGDILEESGHGWIAPLLEFDDDALERDVRVARDACDFWSSQTEIVDVSALGRIWIDAPHRGAGVGLLAAMRLVEMLPHGHDGLLAIPLAAPPIELVRRVEGSEAAGGGDAAALRRLMEQERFGPNERLAAHFTANGAFARCGDFLVSRREKALRALGM